MKMLFLYALRNLFVNFYVLKIFYSKKSLLYFCIFGFFLNTSIHASASQFCTGFDFNQNPKPQEKSEIKNPYFGMGFNLNQTQTQKPQATQKLLDQFKQYQDQEENKKKKT
jgi:hypothetical protein